MVQGETPARPLAHASFRLLGRALAIAPVIVLAGCSWFGGQAKPAEEIALKPIAKPAEPTPVPTPYSLPNEPKDPLAKTQVDVHLDAHIEGDRLVVQIQNLTPRPIIVGPKNFGVIYPGERKVNQFSPKAAGFPIAKLKPSDQVTGLLPLRGLTGQIHGARLVFNHPDCKPAMATIN